MLLSLETMAFLSLNPRRYACFILRLWRSANLVRGQSPLLFYQVPI